MKSILVHLDASPRSSHRLALAQGLARRHGAELTACFAVLPTWQSTPWAFGEGMAAAAALLAEVDAAQRQRGRETFEQAQAQGPVLWAEADADGLMPWLLQRALVADLLVLGQADEDDKRTGALPPGLVPELIAGTGKPALVVPRTGYFEPLARRVLVAWKPTREAARAVTAALPWLQQAQHVHLATQPGPDGELERTLGPLQHWLALHGVQAGVERHRLDGGEVGSGLLSLAADLGAELLVMGCYGHSRTREWVLGGASRTVLEGLSLPVLMAH